MIPVLCVAGSSGTLDNVDRFIVYSPYGSGEVSPQVGFLTGPGIFVKPPVLERILRSP